MQRVQERKCEAGKILTINIDFPEQIVRCQPDWEIFVRSLRLKHESHRSSLHGDWFWDSLDGAHGRDIDREVFLRRSSQSCRLELAHAFSVSSCDYLASVRAAIGTTLDFCKSHSRNRVPHPDKW